MDPISRVVAAGAAGAGAATPGLYVDDLFSSYLYLGNQTARTITNGIDLSGEGGLVWIKSRQSTEPNSLCDTERGAGKFLRSNSTIQEYTDSSGRLSQFNSNGFNIGLDTEVNETNKDFVSWTFRKAPGFFDVVTYSGDGNSSQTISHSLGCAPGMIIIKRRNANDTWYVYHRSIGATKYLSLTSPTSASGATTGVFNNTEPTSTHFTVGSAFYTNSSSGTYVAYLFAHDCGEFGTSGSEDIIQCGSYTGNGSYSGPTVDLGFEPQFLMVKNTSSSADWHVFDTMRGFPVEGNAKFLEWNNTFVEGNTNAYQITPTGLKVVQIGVDWNLSGDKYVYLAIRRPHKSPEAGTNVLDVIARSGTGSTTVVSGDIEPVDFVITKSRNTTNKPVALTRLLGNYGLETDATTVATTNVLGTSINPWDIQDGIRFTGDGDTNASGGFNYINYFFKRAPGFFDVVAYTGTGSAQNVGHNLDAVPELIIVKARNVVDHWQVYSSVTDETDFLMLNQTDATDDQVSKWNDTAPTSSVFTVNTDTGVNQSTKAYVAYLFATLAGISKVGSYSGTGNAINVDCGFAAGARFVMVKRTNGTGDWYVWDSERGIVSGDDPYIFFNSNAAQDTNDDYIDPLNAGFTITSSAPAALNTSGGTYLFLAIA